MARNTLSPAVHTTTNATIYNTANLHAPVLEPQLARPLSSHYLLLQSSRTGNTNCICSPQGRLNTTPLLNPNNFHYQQHHLNNAHRKIHSQNVNGVRSRLPELIADVLANDAGVYMLCETNLDETINSSDVFPPNFNVYRCDRSKETEAKQSKVKKHGGGVLIAVTTSIKSQLLGTGEHHGAEQIWVKIQSENKNIFLVEIYIRPDSPLEVYEANMNALREVSAKMKPEDILIASGDFNLPQLDWITDDVDNPETVIAINASHDKEFVILDTCHELGLFQIIKHSNLNNKMLDLIWTNCTETITCEVTDHHLLKHESHHPAFELTIHGIVPKTNKKTVEFLDFANADYEMINSSFNEIDWNNILHGAELCGDIEKFYEVVNSIIATKVDSKIKKITSHPRWFDKTLISMKNKVNKLHRIWKSTRMTNDKIKYTTQRSEYKKYARLAYRNYKLEMEQLIDDDPMKFFEFVKTCRNTHDDLPGEMEYNGKRIDTQLDIANSFASHFATAYIQPNSKTANVYNYDEPLLRNLCANFPTIDINEDLVLEKINKLPNNMVSGPDGIPNIFIKKCAHTLLKPITHILRESLKTGFVPDIWKKSYVRPVHKSGIRSKIENYRGVALQCIIPKLLDSIIASHLNFHMKSIIDDSQHGFVKGKSTITNLAEFTSRVIEKRIQTDAIYLDIAKAFDSVNVELLIQKLNVMGLNEQLLKWIESYLHDRQQIVKLDETISKPIEVTSGTGQGYPIGPTLFLLFIIDLPRHIKNSIVQSFADDTRLWKHIECYNDCMALQADLDNLVKYFDRNQLKLNVSKTKFISYHRGELNFDFTYSILGVHIDRVSVIKDLGIILDEKLNFHTHIEYITAKAKSRLAWIKRFGREFEDPWTIKRLFSAFILPIVEYGSPIWNPYTAEKINRLESIQKQFLLFALRRMNWPRNRRQQRDFRLPSYKKRLLLLQMNSLEERRKIAQISFVHNIIRGDVSSKYIIGKINMRILSHNVRNREFLQLPIRRHNYTIFEPINSMLSTYNQFYNLKVPNCNTYLIDFNINSDTVKMRMSEYFKSYLNFASN